MGGVGLNVLDGLPEIKVCTGYELGGRRVDILPLDADEIDACVPVYDNFPGWEGSTFGITEWDALPLNARRYIERIAEVVGVGVDIVSTGPDRTETIILRDPFGRA